MKKRKAGVKIWLPGIFLTAILIWQIGVLIAGMREAREIITLTAEGEEESPREMLEQISSFPGYRGGYTQICAEGTLYVGDWSAPVTVWGVDLEEYPLELTGSAGETAVGGQPALAVGEEVFFGLADEKGRTISEETARHLVTSFTGEKAGLFLSVWENRGEEGGKEEGGEKGEKPQEAETGRPALILGTVRGNECYMDQEQLTEIFQEAGQPVKIRRVTLRLQGKKRAEAAASALGEAGLLVTSEKE